MRLPGVESGSIDDLVKILQKRCDFSQLLALSILLNGIQPSAVCLNFGCYYEIGIPLGSIIGFFFKLKDICLENCHQDFLSEKINVLFSFLHTSTSFS